MLPIIIVALVAVVSGATVAINWDKIVIKWKGKRLAILGERGVGKTYFFKFLTTGIVPEGYKANQTSRKMPAHCMKLEEIELYVKEGVDISGSDDAYGQWENVIKNADFVFYMFRIDKIYMADDDTRKRILRDLEHIKGWAAGTGKKEKPIYLIGTYLDQVPGFNGSESELVKFIDKFKKLSVVEKMGIHAGASSKWIFGSAKDELGCAALALEIFRSK